MDPLSAFAGARRFVGVITPSGNTVVERVTIALLRSFPDVSPHFSRTGVVGAVDPYPDSYDWDAMLTAAHLLSHAKPELLIWSGSKAGSISFALDRDLCARIGAQTGLPATTSTLALDEVLRATDARRLAFVTPYTTTYQAKILKTFAREGYASVAEAHSGLADNLSYAAIPPDEIRRMVRQVAAAKPDAIIAWCTNFPCAPLVAELEQETGIAIHDSTSIVLWKALAMLGIDPRPAAAWGRLFAAGLASR